MPLPKPIPPGAAFDVVGFGLNAVDHLCRVPRFPSFDSKMHLEGYACEPGGQVATALVALSRWGLRTSYLGSFGDDALGERSRNALVAEGVDVGGCLLRKGVPNQLAVIIVDRRSGERTVLWYRDPALAIRPEELVRERVCAGRVLHLDGYDREAAIVAAGWARDAGIVTVLDLDSPGRDAWRLLAVSDIAIVSRECAEQLSGSADPAVALQVLAGTAAGLVGISLGRDGVLARADGDPFHVRGFPVSPIDTTGAGDVLHAGVIYGFLAGMDAKGMLRFANAAAALQCTALGAQPAIPTLARIRHLLDDTASAGRD
jgi:sugar/nucleoside kinase (ribokinase family)